MDKLPSPATTIASATEPSRLQPDRLYVVYSSCLRCVTFAGPQRTSPTVPKNMPTPQRVQHNTPAMRKNPSLSRNGGSDAEIMELNQQVESHSLLLPLHWNWLDFYPQRRLKKKRVCFSFFFKLMELKLTVDGLEKERDFYFGKLRDIELICQEPESENHPILSKIMDILYATEVAFRVSPIR